MLSGGITHQNLSALIAIPQDQGAIRAHGDRGELQPRNLLIVNIQLRSPQAHHISDGRHLQQADAGAVFIAVELILQDPLQHVFAEGQIELARQHPQNGHGDPHRPFRFQVGEAAVISQTAVPIFKRVLLTLHHHDGGGAFLPIGLQQFSFRFNRLDITAIGGEHHHRWAFHRWSSRRFGQQARGNLTANIELGWPQQLFTGCSTRDIAAANKPRTPVGAELVFTRR